jgi:replicative DNA helicase
MRRRSEIPDDGDRSPLEPRLPIEEATATISHDVINEIVVIGAALVDSKIRTWLVNRITSDYFFGKGHAAIWRLITELEQKKLQFDPATVEQLSGGSINADYLNDIIQSRPTLPANLKHHVDALEWARIKIEVTRGPINTLLMALRNPTTEPEQLKALSRQVASSFGAVSNKYLRDSEELIGDLERNLTQRRTGIACYPYGVQGLDNYEDNHHTKPGKPRLTPGCAPGQITVITGVSGSGKTTFSTTLAVAQANLKKKVLFGAWEQGSRMTLELMAIQSLGLSRTSFVEGNITDTEYKLVIEEARRLSQYVRFFELPFGRERGKRYINDDNLDLIHSYISETGAQVFIADLWRRAVKQIDPDQEELALCRQQAIAVETNCHCILIHQQRLKDIETRNSKEPTREGLKGSGAWVEVPDTIMAVHRPALWKDIPDDTLSVFILKQRHGPWPLAVEFDWNPDFGSIRNGRSVDYKHPGSGDLTESTTTTMRDFQKSIVKRKRPSAKKGET